MKLSAFEITLIAGFFTVLGWLITYYLSIHLIRRTHQNALELIRRQEINDAANNLRIAFIPIIEALDPADFALKEDLAAFLNSRFNDVRREVIKFSYFLDSETKSRFLETWYEYYKTPDYKEHGYITRALEQYCCIGKTITEQHEIKKLVKTRIDKILEFTNIK